jgi:hypothetical protein
VRPTLSRFSCVERTAVDNLAFVPFLVSNFLDDFVDGRSLLRTWDHQLVGGRHNPGDAFGLWVDGDVVPGSGLQKGDRIFTYRCRGKEPVEIFQKKSQVCQAINLLVYGARETFFTVFDQFLRLSRRHCRRKR